MTPPDRPDILIEWHDELDSTSKLARRLAERAELDEAARVIAARRQTGGVGRFGRAWASPEGGLWMTLIWPLKGEHAAFSPVKIVDALGLRLGRGVLRTINSTLATIDPQLDAQLKFPNDIVIEGRKVCGILTEIVHGLTSPCVLAGVGINANFNVKELPDSLENKCATLFDLTGCRLNLEQLARSVVAHLAFELENNESVATVVESLRDEIYGVGREIKITLEDGQRVNGRFMGLTNRATAMYEIEGMRIELPSPVAE